MGCVLLLVGIAVAGCGGSAISLPHPLSHYVVSTANGFVSYPSDPENEPGSNPAGSSAGSLTLAGAAYMDCAGIGQDTLRSDHWIASYLRIWVDNPSNPGADLFLCVSEFGSTADASRAFSAVRGSHGTSGFPSGEVSSISVPGVPNVQAVRVAIGAAVVLEGVVFATGSFVVTLHGGPVALSTSAPSVPISQVALAEYHALPSS